MRSAAARNEPDADLGLADARRPVGDANVARERQLASPSDAEAVHRRNDGLGEVGHRLVHAPARVHAALLHRRARGELRYVRTRDEGAIPGAVDDGRTHVVVHRQLVEGVLQLQAHLGVHGVELLGTVQRDDGDGVCAPLDEHGPIAHESLQS